MIFIPNFIGIAMISAFNREPLVLTGGMFIMVVALVVRRLPYTIRSSVAILQQIPLYVEEAALSLGSSKPKAFFTVTLPMMSSGVLSGAILSWVTLISELSTAILLYTGKTQTLTVAIYTQIVRGNYGIASAMATVLTLLAPITPHVCEELWERLGHVDTLSGEAWPRWEAAATAQDMLTVALQVNGKLRGTVQVPAEADKVALEQAALADPNVQRHTAGLTVRKVVVVPGKLVNIVAN